MKPGKQSTEFWGKCIIQGVLVMNMLFDSKIDITPEVSIQIVAGIEAMYTLMRGATKTAHELKRQAPPTVSD